MTSWVYSCFIVLIIFLWPLILAVVPESQTQGLFWLCLVINSCAAILVWYYNSIDELSFFKGLRVISASLMSGCANITLLYLPFVLIVVYLIAAFNTFIGLFKGRSFTQEKWVNLVMGFHKHRLYQ
jgi:hypothetical protein